MDGTLFYTNHILTFISRNKDLFCKLDISVEGTDPEAVFGPLLEAIRGLPRSTMAGLFTQEVLTEDPESLIGKIAVLLMKLRIIIEGMVRIVDGEEDILPESQVIDWLCCMINFLAHVLILDADFCNSCFAIIGSDGGVVLTLLNCIHTIFSGIQYTEDNSVESLYDFSNLITQMVMYTHENTDESSGVIGDILPGYIELLIDKCTSIGKSDSRIPLINLIRRTFYIENRCNSSLFQIIHGTRAEFVKIKDSGIFELLIKLYLYINDEDVEFDDEEYEQMIRSFADSFFDDLLTPTDEETIKNCLNFIIKSSSIVPQLINEKFGGFLIQLFEQVCEPATDFYIYQLFFEAIDEMILYGILNDELKGLLINGLPSFLNGVVTMFNDGNTPTISDGDVFVYFTNFIYYMSKVIKFLDIDSGIINNFMISIYNEDSLRRTNGEENQKISVKILKELISTLKIDEGLLIEIVGPLIDIVIESLLNVSKQGFTKIPEELLSDLVGVIHYLINYGLDKDSINEKYLNNIFTIFTSFMCQEGHAMNIVLSSYLNLASNLLCNGYDLGQHSGIISGIIQLTFNNLSTGPVSDFEIGDDDINAECLLTSLTYLFVNLIHKGQLGVFHDSLGILLDVLLKYICDYGLPIIPLAELVKISCINEIDVSGFIGGIAQNINEDDLVCCEIAMYLINYGVEFPLDLFDKCFEVIRNSGSDVIYLAVELNRYFQSGGA